jgi:DNA-binding NtrC family response regulator
MIRSKAPLCALSRAPLGHRGSYRPCLGTLAHRCCNSTLPIDGDELGESARAFIKELSRLGLAQCSIIMASQANIDDAVSATQSGIADYVEIPQPDRQLLAKIRSVMGSARSTPAADSVN